MTAMLCPSKAREKRNKSGERLQRVSSVHEDGPELGQTVRVKEKERGKKRVRGSDPLPFIVDLVQAP